MTGKIRMVILAITMASIAIGVGAIAIFVLYEASLMQQRERLVETAKSQARLIEAIARYNARQMTQAEGMYDPETLFRSTLSQIRDAHDKFDSFGETGEFYLGKREQNQIVFLLSHREDDLEYPKPIPFTSEWGVPMRRALSGKSGTVVGLDYRGRKVLAAHEPAREFHLGVVAKIDVDEIRAPFIKAGFIAGASGLAIITVGMLLFLRIGNPIVRQIEESERKYRGIFESSADMLIIYDSQGVIRDANPACCSAYGHSHKELVGRHVRELVFPAHGGANLFHHEAGASEEAGNLQFESTHVRRDGTSFPTDVRLSPLFHKEQEAVLAAVRDITERKLAEERIRTLSSELIKAQEKERTLVAHDIHDSIGASLAAIKYSLEKNLADLRKGLTLQSESLEKVISTVQTAIEESRRISTNLRPSILDDLGILPTISWFCRQFQEVYSNIEIVREINIQESDVPELLKVVIFRMLQEAFSNVAKHGKADLVRVSMARRGDNIELCVEDNGRGFDPEEEIRSRTVTSGIGLMGMRERAELSGGTLQIYSEVGKGTTIRAVWPCSQMPT